MQDQNGDAIKPRPALAFVDVENDATKAERYKTALGDAVTKVCEIITAAKQQDKLILSFSTQQDAMGKTFISALNVFKEL